MSDIKHTVQLSVGTVELHDKLTWGMQEQIRGAMYGGLKVTGVSMSQVDKLEETGANVEFNAEAITRSKYKAIEVCVKTITLTDGTVVPFSKAWLDNLSVDDGDTLYAAVNIVTKAKKK